MISSHRVFRFLFFFLFLAAITSISFINIVLALVNNDRIAYGVSFENTALNGLSRQEARELLTRIASQRLRPTAAVLSCSGQEWRITSDSIALTADIDATLDAAYAIGRRGNLPANLAEQISCALYGKEIELITSFDHDALQQQLDAIAASIDRAPVSASCSLAADGSIRHTPQVTGKTLDTAPLHEELTSAFSRLQLTKWLTLLPQDSTPPITDQDLAHADGVLAAYTTHFSTANSNRSQNIAIAASELSQVLIRSTKEFSFNETVGARIPSAGYRNAAVIIEGKVEQDIGGGVCQVSSTLYNAILLANLTPTTRTAHFYPSAYVPAGLDATVADGQIDFCFRNDLPHNVYLLSSVYGNTLTIWVLGTLADLGGQDIDLERRIDRGGAAPIVSVWRVYRQNGAEVQREFLHTDTYDEES